MDLYKKRPAPIVSIVGKSNSGKTTLLEKLIIELKSRGRKVGIIKHYAHNGIEVDKPGKDTWRFARMGADAVALVSAQKMFLLRKDDSEMSLMTAAEMLGSVDIILTEGYRWEKMPKIEIVRKANDIELYCSSEELIAVVSDVHFDVQVPCFGLNDINEWSDLIEEQLEKSRVNSENER